MPQPYYFIGHHWSVGQQPLQGGVAAPVRKCREATEAAQTGWSLTTQGFGMHSRNVACERPPRPLQHNMASHHSLDVASTPPL